MLEIVEADILQAGKLTGAIHIPFIGEGDIAAALYSGNVNPV